MTTQPHARARARGALVAAVAATVLAVAGCADDHTRASDPVGPTTPEQDLAPMLLTLADMPDGWAALPLEEGDPMCGPDVTSVAAGFAADPIAGPAVALELSTGGDQLFDAMAHAMDGCQADRGGYHYAFTPLNTTQVGDRSVGYRGAVTRPAEPDMPVGFRQDMVLLQVGDVVGLVQVVNRGTGDTTDLLVRYAALAADRIESRL